MASRLLLSSPSNNDPSNLKHTLQGAARKLPVAGCVLPALRNFYEILGRVIQAAQDVTDTHVVLDRLANDVNTLHRRIECYSHAALDLDDRTDPIESVVQELIKLLESTEEEIRGLKRRNSISGWLSRRGEITKAVEKMYANMRVKMYSIPTLLALAQNVRSDGVREIQRSDIEILGSCFKGIALARYRGSVRIVRSYATEGRQRMESDIRSLYSLRNPHVPQVMGVSSRNWSTPFLVFHTTPFRLSIDEIVNKHYAKRDVFGLCAIATRGILGIEDAVKFLQGMGFLRKIRLLRCALKPGSVIITSSHQLVLCGDVGERCEDTPWPPNKYSHEEFEFHRILVDFCVNVKPDLTPIIFGEKITDPATPDTLPSAPPFSIIGNALDNLAFDATRNYTTWMHKVHQSGLQTATALVPHAEVRQNFQRYCDSFVSLPKTYETRRVYPDSDTCWMAGDVVRWHSPSASDDHTPSLTKLCNIRDLYRLEDSPTDAPDITGACSLSGLVEIEVLDLNGSNWTRYLFEDAEQVAYECNLGGQSYILPPVPGDGEVWPEFDAKLSSLSRQFNVPVDELALVEEVERDHVHGTYEAPLPTFGEPPAKTIYFFVPQDVHREPFWSYNPFPWPDVAAVENARSERRSCVLFICILRSRDRSIEMNAEEGVNNCINGGTRTWSEFCDDSCTVFGCHCRHPAMLPARL